MGSLASRGPGCKGTWGIEPVVWGRWVGSHGAPGAGGRWTNPRAGGQEHPDTGTEGLNHTQGVVAVSGSKQPAKERLDRSTGEESSPWMAVQHSKPVCSPVLGQREMAVWNWFHWLDRSCSWSKGTGELKCFLWP